MSLDLDKLVESPLQFDHIYVTKNGCVVQPVSGTALYMRCRIIHSPDGDWNEDATWRWRGWLFAGYEHSQFCNMHIIREITP